MGIPQQGILCWACRPDADWLREFDARNKDVTEDDVTAAMVSVPDRDAQRPPCNCNHRFDYCRCCPR